MSTVYLLTVEALDGAGDPVTLRFSTDGYHQDGENWLPRLRQPLLFAERARMPWLRSTNESRGEVVLDNSDGRLDFLADYALDGRDQTAQTWDGTTLRTVGRVTTETVEIDRSEIRFLLRPRLAFLTQQHPQESYTGDGSPLEGSADLAGVPKPQVLGRVSNATPVLTDYGLQIYQVSSLADCTVTAARDKGFALTDAGAYASTAELIDPGLTPAAGSFRSYQGFIRLGDTAEALTVDAEQADNTLGAVASQIITAAGATPASPLIDPDPYAPSAQPPTGIYLRERRTTENMLDALAASLGGFWLRTTASEVRFAALEIGTPVAEIPAHRIRRIERRAGGAGANGLPVYRVAVQFDRVATVQELLDTGAANAQRWRSEFREAAAEDAATRARHPLSQELVTTTALRSDGSALASRLLALLSPRRDTTEVTTRLGLFPAVSVGQTVRVVHPRLGYAAGRDMIVTGRVPDAATGEIVFELWG